MHQVVCAAQRRGDGALALAWPASNTCDTVVALHKVAQLVECPCIGAILQQRIQVRLVAGRLQQQAQLQLLLEQLLAAVVLPYLAPDECVEVAVGAVPAGGSCYVHAPELRPQLRSREAARKQLQLLRRCASYLVKAPETRQRQRGAAALQHHQRVGRKVHRLAQRQPAVQL